MFAQMSVFVALGMMGQPVTQSNPGEWSAGPTLPIRPNYYIAKYKQVWGLIAPSGKLSFLVGGNWPVSTDQRKEWDSLGFSLHGPEVAGPHSVPFITEIESNGPLNNGFADVFNPKWQPAIDDFWKNQASGSQNPLWLGAIVDPGFKFGSEVGWGATAGLVREDPEGTFGQRMRAFAKQRFGQITRLNSAWGTSFTSFDSVTLRPDSEANEGEKTFVHAFGSLWFETYIKSIARSMVATMPGLLYFGYNMPVYEDNDRRMFLQFAAHAVAIHGPLEEFELLFSKPGFAIARPYLVFVTGTSETNPELAAKKWENFVVEMAKRSEVVGVMLDVSPLRKSALAPFVDGKPNRLLAEANKSVTDAVFRTRFNEPEPAPE